MSRHVTLLVFAFAFGCQDPVRSDRIDGLGDERRGVPEGPTHRPGQPCVLCHGGDGPGNSEFVFAGTVYQTEGPAVALSDAIVRLIDSRGVKYETGTNCAGNFFVLTADYEPVFPVWAKVIFGQAAGVPVEKVMGSPIYRERSCATCHYDPRGPESAGHVFLAPEGVPLPEGLVSLTRNARPLLAGLTLLCSVACKGPTNGVFSTNAPSLETFAPVGGVLEIRCGTLDCHGNSARNLRVYGIDGVRLDPEGVTGDQSTTDSEITATYESVISLQPEVLTRIVNEHGQRPERWLLVTKGRGVEGHKGGTRMNAGDDSDACITSWLVGTVDIPRCDVAALLEPPGGEGF